MRRARGTWAALRWWSECFAMLAITFAAAVATWANWPRPSLVIPLPAVPVDVSNSPSVGSAVAPVVVIEYSDFECPYCGDFWRVTLPVLRGHYIQTGRILLVFKYLPLEAIHPMSLSAAEAAECAARQGKFWEMHDQLFARQKHLDMASLMQWAGSLGLDVSEFQQCLSGRAVDRVRRDSIEAKAFSIVGTPTFLIGRLQPDGRVQVTQRIAGTSSASDFRTAVDLALGRTLARSLEAIS
jgi:protein-disulfide isomerase